MATKLNRREFQQNVGALTFGAPRNPERPSASVLDRA